MRPYLCDKRTDGGDNPPNQCIIDDDKDSFYQGAFVANPNSRPAPIEVACNGYFYCENPAYFSQYGKEAIAYRGNVEVSGTGVTRGNVNLLAFSYGYLSGNRYNLGSQNKNIGYRGDINLDVIYNPNAKHICVNQTVWCDNNSRGLLRSFTRCMHHEVCRHL